MAVRGIVVPFTADVRKWATAIRSIGRDLDGVVGDLRGVERAADSSMDDVERSFRGAGDTIEAAFEGLGRQVEGEFDRMERAARQADTDMTTAVRSGSFRGAAGALAAEAGDEFVESWGEAIREGNPAGVVRELFSNAALIGAAAGGPIGAGIGLAVSFVTSFIDQSAKERERVGAALSTLFDQAESAEVKGRDAARAFLRGYVEENEIPQNIADALGLDDIGQAMLKVRDLSEQTGLSQRTIRDALLGQDLALVRVQQALRDNQEQYERNLDAAGRVKDRDQDRFLRIMEQNDLLGDQAETLREVERITLRENQANRDALAAFRTKQEITGRTARNLERGRDAARTTALPDFSRQASDAGTIARSLRDARDYWRELGPKSIEITLDYRTRGAPSLGDSDGYGGGVIP